MQIGGFGGKSSAMNSGGDGGSATGMSGNAGVILPQAQQTQYMSAPQPQIHAPHVVQPMQGMMTHQSPATRPVQQPVAHPINMEHLQALQAIM